MILCVFMQPQGLFFLQRLAQATQPGKEAPGELPEALRDPGGHPTRDGGAEVAVDDRGSSGGGSGGKLQHLDTAAPHQQLQAAPRVVTQEAQEEGGVGFPRHRDAGDG